MRLFDGLAEIFFGPQDEEWKEVGLRLNCVRAAIEHGSAEPVRFAKEIYSWVRFGV